MKQTLKLAFPRASDSNIEKYAEPLEDAMRLYNINTIDRKSAFLAQVGHESGQLSAVVENLNYSAVSLLRVFGKYFDNIDIAKEYERQPEKIANLVYANRMGNGNVESGDGWRYRGRGLIQLTGRSNYDKATFEMYALPFGVDFGIEPDLVATPEYAAKTAAWFWDDNGLNELGDRLSENKVEYFRQITRRINGGYNGLENRLALYDHIKQVLK